MPSPLLIYGPIITPLSCHDINYLPYALLCVEGGIIKWIEELPFVNSTLEEILHKWGLPSLEVRRLRKGEFLMPGFIDTHTHAPQFPNLGRGGQVQLLDWLEKFTFPVETKFADKHYAEKVYGSVVRRSLDCGTTTCCYFGTTHLTGNKILAEIVKSSGQRGFIGHCNMNRNTPKDLAHSSTFESLETTRAFITHVKSLECRLVRPILTPRFAISCTDDLLKGLGDLAREKSDATDPHHLLPIQTHISENIAENKLTASLFPDFPTYASIYDGYGLLGPTTILAHGCHLSSDEVALIKKRGAGISHCPTSNFNLSSGVAHVGEWLDKDVKVGLGTDVSGGFSVSMLTAIRNANIASKIFSMQTAPAILDGTESSPPASDTPAALTESTRKPFANRPLPIATLLYMATLGGAGLCNLETHTGSLTPGKAFDAILVNIRREAGNPNMWDFDDGDDDGSEITKVDGKFLEASLEKFLFCGDDRNISAVWVEGNLVGGRTFHIDGHMSYN